MRTFFLGLGLAVGLGLASPVLAQSVSLQAFQSEDELKTWLADQARQIRQHEIRFVDLHHTQLRLQGGERIIGDLGPRGGNA